MMNFAGFLLLIGTLFTFHFSLFTSVAEAAPITYRHKHFLFTIDPALHPEWHSGSEEWTYNGIPFDPPASWKVDGDTVPPLPVGVDRHAVFSWNRESIRETIEKIIAKPLRRAPGKVTIQRDAKGDITFEGVGLTGRDVDADAAAGLTIAAIQQNLTDIELPVVETQPEINVDDPQLVEDGIREVVTIGESTFTGSPVNRRHNIGVGLRRFNGQLIPAGAEFSFNAVLGKVDGSTGYRLELVIKGDRTEPDYGGGLCQISTTAYRGVWEYGFPILKRKNHSYTVRYYAPAGTDATVYPGAVDMVFKNDLPTSLLIQTYQEDDHAYFIYYGTRDTRTTEIVGPFIDDKTPPPPDKVELTLDLPPGQKKKLNERVPGQKATWYRFVTSNPPSGTDEKTETVYSHYEARPLFTALGVAQLPEGYGSKVIDGEAPVESDAASSVAPVQTSSAARRGIKPPTRR